MLITIINKWQTGIYYYQTVHYLFPLSFRTGRSDHLAHYHPLELGLEEADVLNVPDRIFQGQSPDPNPSLHALDPPVPAPVPVPVPAPVHDHVPAIVPPVNDFVLAPAPAPVPPVHVLATVPVLATGLALAPVLCPE